MAKTEDKFRIAGKKRKRDKERQVEKEHEFQTRKNERGSKKAEESVKNTEHAHQSRRYRRQEERVQEREIKQAHGFQEAANDQRRISVLEITIYPRETEGRNGRVSFVEGGHDRE